MKPADPSGVPDPPASRRARNRIDAGIEIGSSKVCVAVGERKGDGPLRILGVGQAPSRGVRMGEIVDFGLALECIRKALTDAEDKSDVVIGSVLLAVTGSHIGSFNRRAMIDIPDFRAVIDEGDCDRVCAEARKVVISERDVFLHTLLQHYRIDGQPGIRNPVGMRGSRLEAAFHVIHGMRERIKSSIRCIRELGIEVDDIVFSPLAASRAVLTQEQKNEGALLLDIGAGTTDYILYIDGEVRQSGVLAIGGDFVNHDLSHHFHIPFETAESLKIGYGNALIGQHPVDEPVPPDHFPAPDGRAIGREELNAIIHARTWNIIEMLIEHLGPDFDARSLRAGLLLTGGTSKLRGIRQLAESAFEMPVHLIHEQPAAGFDGVFQNPQFSTALGLLCLHERFQPWKE